VISRLEKLIPEKRNKVNDTVVDVSSVYICRMGQKNQVRFSNTEKKSYYRHIQRN